MQGTYELKWDRNKEYGYFPVDEYVTSIGLESDKSVYDEAYFDKYKSFVHDSKGKSINQARVDLVYSYLGELELGLDIGIGCGTFVASTEWFGFDVNPAGIAWLKRRNDFVNMYDAHSVASHNITAFSFWDSFEHIKDLKVVMSSLPQWVFMSLPIFTSEANALASKHFRKDEHYHYFTSQALVDLFNQYNYELVEQNSMESDLGRESIGTFVFKKIDPLNIV